MRPSRISCQTLAGVALVTLAALVLFGCKKEVSVSVGHATLKEKQLPFTFNYPVDWENSAAKDDSTGILALVNIKESTLLIFIESRVFKLLLTHHSLVIERIFFCSFENIKLVLCLLF